jgi:hypothetical protein
MYILAILYTSTVFHQHQIEHIREIPFAVYGGNTLCPDKLKAMKIIY